MKISVDTIALKSILEEESVSVIAKIQDSLEKNKVNATGRFSRSLQYEIKSGDTITSEITSLDYAEQIEKGFKGFVSPDKIKEWIDAKRIPYTNGLEVAISRSIMKRGTLQFQGRGLYTKPITSVTADPNLQSEILSKLQEISIIDISIT